MLWCPHLKVTLLYRAHRRFIGPGGCSAILIKKLKSMNIQCYGMNSISHVAHLNKKHASRIAYPLLRVEKKVGEKQTKLNRPLIPISHKRALPARQIHLIVY